MKTLAESILDADFLGRDNSIDIAAKEGKTLADTVMKLKPRISKQKDKITYYFNGPNDKRYPKKAQNRILAAIKKIVDKIHSLNMSPKQSDDAYWIYEDGYFMACTKQEDGRYLVIVTRDDDISQPDTTFWISIYKTNNASAHLFTRRWGEPAPGEIISSIALYLGFEV